MTSSMDMSSSAPLTHLAATYMAEHRFPEAADYAQRALSLRSGDLSPFGLLGDAHADMGEYDQAAQDYEKLLLHLAPEEPAHGLVYMHDSRVSYLKFIHGDDTGAIELARKAVNTAVGLHMPFFIEGCDREVAEVPRDAEESTGDISFRWWGKRSGGTDAFEPRIGALARLVSHHHADHGDG
jgi:hypothetical protein